MVQFWFTYAKDPFLETSDDKENKEFFLEPGAPFEPGALWFAMIVYMMCYFICDACLVLSTALVGFQSESLDS